MKSAGRSPDQITNKLTASMEQHMILALVLITLRWFQSTTASPKMGIAKSQAWKRGDEREKKKAAKSKKGVVGSTGTKAPMKPKRKKIQPQAKRIGLSTRRLLPEVHKKLSLTGESGSTRHFDVHPVPEHVTVVLGIEVHKPVT